MKARFFSLVLLTVSMLVGCTEVNDPVLDQEVNQNEENIAQLKAMAEEAGWIVSPKVLESARTTPLTKVEIAQLQEDLDIYSQFPQTEEKRQMEVIPFGNLYVFSPVFLPRVMTRAVSSGSLLVYATFGSCWSNVCNQIPIKVYYDLDEKGNVVYAFGGTEYSINGGGPIRCFCNGANYYSTLYYKCEWGNTIFLKLWISRYKEYNIGYSRIYLYSEGNVDIKTGNSHFETHEISKSELPPEIFNP